jgi:PHP family Zn ribbon phosphoesterase
MAADGLRRFRADLHVHTVLSPCAEVEMIPPLIVQQAMAEKIDIIAITDHNASANVRAVQDAAAGTRLTVLPGMELQTREEVHLLCLFDTLSQLEDWQRVVDDHLPPLRNRPRFFGEQFVVDRSGDYVSTETRMLAVSAELSLDCAVVTVDGLGGLAIPAHIDLPAFSLIANLGFVPAQLPIHALEVSRHTRPSDAKSRNPMLRAYSLIQNGDVHLLDDFLGSTEFLIAYPTVSEIRLALQRRWKRAVHVMAAHD